MATRNLAYRIGVDGDNVFVDAQRRMGDSAVDSSARAQAALDRYNRQLADTQDKVRKASVAVAQAQPSSVAQTINAAVGINDNAQKSARASAEAMAQAFADEERRALALRDAIDPLAAAQRRLAVETANADQLLARGAITQAERTAAVALAKKAF